MATLMRYETLYHGYYELVPYLKRHGVQRAPRGLRTLELADVVIELNDPTKSLPIGCGRRLVVAIGVAEALQLISGTSVPELLAKIAPNMRQFMNETSDGLLVQHGAYGPRAAWQVDRVLQRLRDDPDTRQAIIAVYNPALDLVDPVPVDVPCTLSLRLGIEWGDYLTMTTLMRSNDVWWGLAYDAFQFTQLQCSLANALDLHPGRYTHFAASLHLYERDWAAADEIHRPNRPAVVCTGVGRRGMEWTEIADRARRILDGLPIDQPTETEDYFVRTLEQHR